MKQILRNISDELLKIKEKTKILNEDRVALHREYHLILEDLERLR